MRPYYYYLIPLYILCCLITYLPLRYHHDLIARSFFRGPIDIRLQSATLSAFSPASWIFREISAQGTMSLEFKSLLLDEKIFYDRIHVLISHNGDNLLMQTLTPFAQPPGCKSEVNVTFSTTIDASAIEEFLTLDDVVSFNVSVLADVIEEKNAKWRETKYCHCSDVRLQFFQGSDVAEMLGKKPALCKCESLQRTIPENPDSKFHDIMNKIRGIIEVFYYSS